jgi:hypothetical protein
MTDWTPGQLPAGEVPASAREFRSDFEQDDPVMQGASTERRPDAISHSYLLSPTLGPEQLSDPSLGVLRRVWYARADNATGTVHLSRENGPVGDADGVEPEAVLFSYVGDTIVEIDSAFDQNAAPVVCAERGAGQLWLYWFNVAEGAATFEHMGVGRSPRIILDYPENAGDSDLLLFYINDVADALCYRVQREAFAVEHQAPLLGVGGYALADVALLPSRRLRVLLVRRDEDSGRWASEAIDSTLYPYPPAPERFTTATLVQHGELREVLLSVQAAELYATSVVVLTGDLREYIIDYAPVPEQVTAGSQIQSGVLAELTINVGVATDPGLRAEQYIGASVVFSGSLAQIVVDYTYATAEQYTVATTIQSGDLT